MKLAAKGLMILGAGLLVLGAGWRAARMRAAVAAPAAARPVIVGVAPIQRRDLFQELTVQAEFRPYQEVELYSEVAGYLKAITVDFGDRVRAGQLLATIEVPELADELKQAQAAELRTEADFHNAHLDYTRLAEVNRTQPNLVAQQDLDTAEARDHALAAAVSGAKAEVEKFQTLYAYTRITAPFDGVITARSADPGALIQASTRSPASPLLRLSENQRLRLDFPVSVSFAGDIAVGDPVEIHLAGSAGFRLAIISRFSRRITTATRTMETEVEVPNADLKLIPGMYATVVLKLNRHPGSLAAPVEAVSSGGSPNVYVVNAEDTVEERPVKLGLETANYYEVLSGLRAGDRVVVENRSGVQPGSKVEPQTVPAAVLP